MPSPKTVKSDSYFSRDNQGEHQLTQVEVGLTDTTTFHAIKRMETGRRAALAAVESRAPLPAIRSE
jgi:hypothetical protein